jgi:predicted RNase H-like nuclease (RuvC/YqgF family)
MSPQLSDLKKRFTQLNKYTCSLKNKYDTLEFNYEEEKAQREDLEERLKSENKKMSLVCINNIDTDLRDFYIQSNINSHFFLDLECLTKQITAEITINFEAVYRHFAQKANEYRKVNCNKLKVFKQKLTKDQPKLLAKESDDLKVESFKKEIAANDQQIKLLNDENEQLKKKNALLNESLDAFKLENEMLKTSCNKLQDSFQNLSIKHEQTENQAIEFEKINQELMEDLKKYSESQSNFNFIFNSLIFPL